MMFEGAGLGVWGHGSRGQSMVSGIEKLALRGQAMLGAGAAAPAGGPRRPTRRSSAATALR